MSFFAKQVPAILAVSRHAVSYFRGFKWLVASCNSFRIAEDLHGFMR